MPRLHFFKETTMELKRLERLLITEVSGVDDPANQLPGWMVTKARRAAILEAAETLRKACADDDLFVSLVRGESILFSGQKTKAVFKARHSVRGPDARFQAVEPTTTVGGLTVRHGGSVHPTLRALAARQARGKRVPSGGGQPDAGSRAYGGSDTRHVSNPGRPG